MMNPMFCLTKAVFGRYYKFLPSMTQLLNSGSNKGHEMPLISLLKSRTCYCKHGWHAQKTHWWQCTTSSFFLLLADQSKDTSKKEQLAVVVRHVNDKAIFNEWFLTFVEATSLTAKSLTTYFTFTLTEDGLDPALIDLRDTMELLSGVEAVPVCSSNWEKYLHVLHISTAHKLCSCWLHKEHSVHLRSFLSAWGSI